MRLFHHRSDSTSSSKSRTSTIESFPDVSTGRTSLDSNDLSETIKPCVITQKAPLLNLPIELIQHITSYLDAPTAASFCLSSRYICYSLGTARLTSYVEASKSRFEKRKNLEAIVERAFTNHWFCAWCDKFHPWDARSQPTSYATEKRRDCAEFNSYLHDEKDYVLCYHHVRLAVNRALWGEQHGIPLARFDFSKAGMAKVYKTQVPTKLEVSARIVDGHFLLHSSYAMILPEWCTTKKNILNHVWPVLPHILVGHRDSTNGHSGIMAAIDNVIRRNWQYLYTQNCSNCATDWTVACHHFPHATGGQARLVIQTWRDLGRGRNPFDSSWRAHGVCVNSLERCNSAEAVRLSGLQAGDIRRAFETAGDGTRVFSKLDAAEREKSPTRARIYRAFMRKGSVDVDDDEVRRSRARPRLWRLSSANADAERREEEERLEEMRLAVESAMRLDAEATRRSEPLA